MTAELYERVVHAFEPVIGLVQALFYTIGLIVNAKWRIVRDDRQQGKKDSI